MNEQVSQFPFLLPSKICGVQKRFYSILFGTLFSKSRIAFDVFFYVHSRVPCHIVHLSSASALPMIRKAREEGVPLTIETTHHYLSLLAEHVPDGATQFKCCPPVRDANNQVSRSSYSSNCLCVNSHAKRGKHARTYKSTCVSASSRS